VPTEILMNYILIWLSGSYMYKAKQWSLNKIKKHACVCEKNFFKFNYLGNSKWNEK